MTLQQKLDALRVEIKALAAKSDISKEEAAKLEELITQAETVKMQIKALGEVEEGDKEIKEAREAELEKAKEEGAAEAEKKLRAEFAKTKRLPFSAEDAPITAKFGELGKYDNLDVADQALLIGILDNAKRENVSKLGPSGDAYKALAIKITEDKTRVGAMGMKAMLKAGVPYKSDEVMQQDLASYGDEWVGIAYSQALWEAIRVGTFVADNLPAFEVPPGMESIFLPIESTDPTWYKVAETTDHDSTMLFPVASVTSSKVTTGRVQLTLAKMGCRVPWSGELEEDSLIPFVAEVRRKIEISGSEQLEHAIIDGDTDTTASTNINDIAGTPAATDLFLLFNGFRKSPLVTTTANSRDGGALDENDFLETVKLMGTGGKNGADVNKVAFIQDANVRWKSLELATVKTRDVFGSPTIENGVLSGIWGYKVHTSYNMHYRQASLKANSAGKVDLDTAGNNTTGSLLAVRWDQWQLGYRRRMTIETTRYPRSDSSEIVALMRLGLIQRDTEASAVSYNITV
jgi:hypothetical protein